jgi:hypothetical protein
MAVEPVQGRSACVVVPSSVSHVVCAVPDEVRRGLVALQSCGAGSVKAAAWKQAFIGKYQTSEATFYRCRTAAVPDYIRELPGKHYELTDRGTLTLMQLS